MNPTDNVRTAALLYGGNDAMCSQTKTDGWPPEVRDTIQALWGEKEELEARLHAARRERDELLAAAIRIIEGLADGGELGGLPSGTPVSVPTDDIVTLCEAVARAEGGE